MQSVLADTTEEGIQAYGEDSKIVVDVLQSQNFQLVAPRAEQLGQNTSRPRKEGVRGRAIDWIAVKRGKCSRVHIQTNSCYQIGTDDDLLKVEIHGKCRATLPKVSTGRRESLYRRR